LRPASQVDPNDERPAVGDAGAALRSGVVMEGAPRVTPSSDRHNAQVGQYSHFTPRPTVAPALSHATHLRSRLAAAPRARAVDCLHHHLRLRSRGRAAQLALARSSSSSCSARAGGCCCGWLEAAQAASWPQIRCSSAAAVPAWLGRPTPARPGWLLGLFPRDMRPLTPISDRPGSASLKCACALL
jgi:hypothetical protein